MRRQVIAGGAIVIVSVASAAAFTILEGRWPEALPPPNALRAETSNLSSVTDKPSDATRETAPPPLAQARPNEGEATQDAPTSMPAPSPAANRAVVKPAIACDNPNAMGVSRVVEIDTTGGPGFGFQHFKTFDFLRDHEVVLTFDDGPWPTTPAVLKALSDQCLRATFLSIGKHATYHPEILRQIIAAGHTVGSHTWSHADLQAVMKKSGLGAAEEEIEKGASAVHLMAGTQIAPFVRFPYLRHPPELLRYLGERNIAILSCDIDSSDYRIKKPEELTKTLIAKLNKAGKGIILMHDFQKVTSIALPQILAELQKNGFKVVHMVPKEMLATLPQYDEAVLKENKLPTLSDNKAVESVVRTIRGN
jgi:peptidoglycan/xylan/chitin deacetylase (PgdA/CDA1 family)